MKGIHLTAPVQEADGGEGHNDGHLVNEQQELLQLNSHQQEPFGYTHIMHSGGCSGAVEAYNGMVSNGCGHRQIGTCSRDSRCPALSDLGAFSPIDEERELSIGEFDDLEPAAV